MPALPLGSSLLPLTPFSMPLPLTHYKSLMRHRSTLDMHPLAKSDNPTYTTVQSDDVPVPFEVQQPVQQQQQQQEKRSILELTQSVTTIDLGMERLCSSRQHWTSSQRPLHLLDSAHTLLCSSLLTVLRVPCCQSLRSRGQVQGAVPRQAVRKCPKEGHRSSSVNLSDSHSCCLMCILLCGVM